MVLSSYCNWGTDVHNAKQVHHEDHQFLSENEANDHQQLLQCYDYCQWDTFEDQLSYAFLDPYIDLNANVLHPQNYTPFIPYLSSSVPNDPFNVSEIGIPYENFSSKRQKLIQDDHHNNYCSDFVPAAAAVFYDATTNTVALNSVLPCMPDDHQSNYKQQNHKVGAGNYGEKCKKVSDEKRVSVQSIAARERRRKITEKTQELGKLVPGGNRMNTAEMLQAAFNYIKFLQAQLGILQLMDSFQENDEKGACKEKEKMEIVTSAKVQEKLYMEEKCLVPKDIVVSLIKLSKPALSDKLSRLLPLASHSHH